MQQALQDATVDIVLEPFSQLAPVREGWWRATGGDPAFVAVRADGVPFRAGWAMLEFEAEVGNGALYAPCLYPDYGTGGHEFESIRLPLEVARRGSHAMTRLIRFKADLVGLRFDPSVLPASFSVRLRMRPVSRGEAIRMLVSHAFERRGVLGKAWLALRTAGDFLLGGPRRIGNRLYVEYEDRRELTQHADYSSWLELYDDRLPETLEAAREAAAAIAPRPRVSVVVPVYNTAEKWLRRCIDSVREQTYDGWEMCIANDASTEPHVRAVLDEYAAIDPRIRVVHRERNGHIAEASNSALALATGDYVALLDHDDELHPFALAESVRAFQRNPGWRMLFTDEDKIDEAGKRSDPYFKSDWNPDLFLVQNCVCHLGVYAREVLEQVGGFRAGFDGAQDWDLMLRVSAVLSADQIGHLPKPLYHWRTIEGSTALAPGEKGYAHFAAIRAISDHLEVAGNGAKVEEISGYSGYYRVRWPLPDPAPLVSILVPTRDKVGLVRACVESVTAKTDYPRYEIVILDNGSVEPATLRYFRDVVADPRVRVERYDAPFNYSALNNFGASRARGEVLVLLNNDITVISHDWLREMVSHAIRPDVGAVGAMLYYPDDRIQHAGVILGIGGVAGHCYVGNWRGYSGDKHRAQLTQSLSAVTAACLAVRRSVFDAVGGLDEGIVVAFNDIDFCLRVREAGYRNVWTPYAELYHHESATRGYEDSPEKIARFKREESFMKARWGAMLRDDPYYNVNLSLETAPFSLGFPPREELGCGVVRSPASAGT